MSTTTEPDVTYVEGWEQIDTTDGYRVCGVAGLIWFIQGPLNNVIAHPPAHLPSMWEALDWFRRQQNERKHST